MGKRRELIDAASYLGKVCMGTVGGTFGAYAEGLTLTSTGLAACTLSGATAALKVGQWLSINGGATPRLIVSIIGTAIVFDYAIPAGAGLSIAYAPPDMQEFGALAARSLDLTITIDFPSIPAHGVNTWFVIIPGAQLGDFVQVTNSTLNTGQVMFSGYVTTADTVGLNAVNMSASPIDLGPIAFRVRCIHP